MLPCRPRKRSFLHSTRLCAPLAANSISSPVAYGRLIVQVQGADASGPPQLQEVHAMQAALATPAFLITLNPSDMYNPVE
jgi:hypothetical protein